MVYKKKGGWGGKRPRSGPKPKHGSATAIYSVRLSPEQVALLRTWGGGDLSAGLRWVIDMAEARVRRVEYTSQPPPPPTP